MGVGWLMVRVGRMCGGSGKFFKDFHLPFWGSGDRFLVEFFVFRLCRSALEGVSCPCGSVCGLVEVWCWVAGFFVFRGRMRKKILSSTFLTIWSNCNTKTKSFTLLDLH